MKTTFRLSVAVLLFSAALPGQLKPADELVERLREGDPPRVMGLGPGEKFAAVSQLQAARAGATGRRLQQVAFLLAALGADYEKNRDYLLAGLRGCSLRDYSDCDEETAGFLVRLYQQGHHEVLQALMIAGMNSDGALSEMLGPFYGDVLFKDPSGFIAGLRQLDGPHQKRVCHLASSGDDGGLAPEALQKARRRLKRIADDVALQCLQEIEASERESEINSRQ